MKTAKKSKRMVERFRKTSGFRLMCEIAARLKAQGLDDKAIGEHLSRDEKLSQAMKKDLVQIFSKEIARYVKGKKLTADELREVMAKILESHIRVVLPLASEPKIH